MHPIPLDILISEQNKQRRKEQQPQQIQLPLPAPPPPDYEERNVSEDNEEKRGVVIIDINGDVTEDFIV
tara:strand:+ start:40 stop:246 length:207 start_codon:yes stop_codon:yes gene_type:complete